MSQIKIFKPLPFEKITSRVVYISGIVSDMWLKNDRITNNSLTLHILDIHGKIFMGQSVGIVPCELSENCEKMFVGSVEFSVYNVPFINDSQGLITFHFQGINNEQNYFLPVIISPIGSEFQPDTSLVEKHKLVGEYVIAVNKEKELFDKEMNEIMKRRQERINIPVYKNLNYLSIDDSEFLMSLDNIIGDSDFGFGVFRKEEEEIKKIQRKYKKVTDMYGFPCHGDVLSYWGFHFIVYSNDHGKHFHVIHRGRGIDAKFSFPDMYLEKYKGGVLNKKEIKRITSFLKLPKNFNLIKAEFNRREVLIG